VEKSARKKHFGTSSKTPLRNDRAFHQIKYWKDAFAKVFWFFFGGGLAIYSPVQNLGCCNPTALSSAAIPRPLAPPTRINPAAKKSLFSPLILWQPGVEGPPLPAGSDIAQARRHVCLRAELLQGAAVPGGCGRGGKKMGKIGGRKKKILPFFSRSFGRAQKSSSIPLGGSQYCFADV